MSALDQAAVERHWYDLPYWLANFPDVRLNPSDNGHVDPRTLRVAWTSQAAPPIVAVEITPRYLPPPDKPGDFTGIFAVLQGVAGIVGAGSIVKLALTAASIGEGIASGIALQDWAKSFKASPDDFSPQYSPVPFTVPMPLDRAQIMVSRPWYAPAMVYQFQQELQTGKLRTTADAYRALLQAMLPAGWSDPPPDTSGEAPLFRFVNPFATVAETTNQGNGEMAISGSSAADSPTPQIPVSAAAATATGALPLLLAAALLIAGAPIILAVGVGYVLWANKK